MAYSTSFCSMGGGDAEKTGAYRFMPGASVLDSENLEARRTPCYEDGIEQMDGCRTFVAVSPAMREVRRQVDQVANIDASVLLLGESGTGKEVIARLIHKLSSRASRRFLKVNCAALPAELLESELFGYEAGAFTGARQARAGKFEACHQGTMLLDEIAEMPVPPQAKLLHVLQDGEFSRLGSSATAKVDVRILAATNVNVHEAVQSGRLRADLYYRLNVFEIHLPPLRERKEDLPYLLNHLMTYWAEHYGRPRLPITRRVLEACASYPWPGNVRELETFVKRYLVLGDESRAVNQLEHELHIGCVSGASAEGTNTTGCGDLKVLMRGIKFETERVAILQALEQADGSKQEAAPLLRISLRALHYKIRRYGIEARSRTTAATCSSVTTFMARSGSELPPVLA